MTTQVDKMMPEGVAADPRWARVLARDKGADGTFWYSVATTGVYCRPSCASRAANPRNVALHDTLEAAKATGFRPCRRCNPDALSADAEDAARVARSCRTIAAAQTAPALATLAATAGLSPAHFHRLFRRVTGVTPRAYAAACRAGRVRDALAQGGSVTDAMHGAGYGSSGRFYAVAPAILGMTPSRYRAGGGGETLRFALHPCSLGTVLVAASALGIAAILIGDDPRALADDLRRRFPQADLVGGDAAFEEQVAQVVGFVEAPGLGLDLPLDVRGTAFQQRVWETLRAIPPGATASYAEIAARVGVPAGVRAVAGACAANALAVAIPCHRVVRSDGGLSGYRWGVERKRALLEREAREAEALQAPK